MMSKLKIARLWMWIFATTLGAFFTLTSLAADSTTGPPSPNVLFIAIDDLNDWVGCLDGHPQVQTPNIDALAARGMNFQNAHCQAPICNPSRISMLLGQLPSTTGHYFLTPGFRDVKITENATTIFQHFRNHGYYAATCGKIFHGRADVASFDEIEKSKGWRRSDVKLHFTVPESHPLWDWGQVETPDEDMRDYHTAKWAAKRLPELSRKDQPFFMAVGFHLPHVPIYASKKWFDLYPLDSVKLPPSLDSDRDDIPDYAQQLSLNMTAPRHQWMLDHHEDLHAVQAYLAVNSFVDHLVGIVLEGLESSDEADNTVVVLWSDHGFHMGEKQKWAKRSLWEETTRVPLIVAGLDIAANKTNAPVGLIDVFPTLNDLCGIPTPKHLDGVSLRPLLDDPQVEWARNAICTFGKNNHSIRSNDYRYTIYDDGSQELYDHRIDPNEWKNLADDARYASVIRQHQQSIPAVNVDAVPNSRGSDSPIYGEAKGLQSAMKKK